METESLPLGLRFSLLHRSCKKKMDEMLQEKGLTGVQFRLLALLIHRGGMGVTAKKVCALMFEDDGEMDQKNMNYFFKLYYDLVRVLQEAGAGEVLQKHYNSYCVDMSRIRVDDTGKGTLPYLEEYDWAEEV